MRLQQHQAVGLEQLARSCGSRSAGSDGRPPRSSRWTPACRTGPPGRGSPRSSSVTRSCRPAAAMRSAGVLVLLARDGGGGHAAAVVARGVQRHAAPAGADLQQVVVGLQLELAADALAACASGASSRRGLGAAEHRRRVHHGRVEEQLEQLVAEVVVGGDVAPRALAGVAVQPVQARAAAAGRGAPGRPPGRPARRGWRRTGGSPPARSGLLQHPVHVGLAGADRCRRSASSA